MNRSAYLTTGMAIKTLSRLSRANIVIHGREHVPGNAAIFVVNHFTRIETFFLPYHIFNLTGIPVWSLANAKLFQGGFGRFLELVGAVSTRDPQRDELVIKTLLTGEANWIIFPEGSMIKTKKIMHGGKYMVTDPKGMHEPHTGAATLALRAELFRRYLLLHSKKRSSQANCSLEYLGLGSVEEMGNAAPTIVPVNLTYYPLRAHENVASSLTEKLVKGVSERVLEEIMTEGTMLLAGVDVDIRFGKPIDIGAQLAHLVSDEELLQSDFNSFVGDPFFKTVIQGSGRRIMQQYMRAIYSMTTVNHEHLFASFLRMYPYEKIQKKDLQRRVFYAASLLQEREYQHLFLHKSMQEDQSHLVVDDRYRKFENFLQLAIDKGIVKKEGETLVRDRSKLSAPVSFHRGRIDNPVEVIANEVEPLKALQKFLYSLAWQPDFLLKLFLIRYLLKKANQQYHSAVEQWCSMSGIQKGSGKPIFYSSIQKRTGILLVHSYLATPLEVKEFAGYLHKKGYWVYAPRLPGHGTCAADLAGRSYQEWINEVDAGYALLSNTCRRVVVGGVSVGGNLALHLASRVPDIAGVFAICPPMQLRDYSSTFMPASDTWNKMVQKIKGEHPDEQFLKFAAESPHINYDRNPVQGIKQVGNLLDDLEKRFAKVTMPSLIIHADHDPVVRRKGSRKLFDRLASVQKEYVLMNSDRHVIVQGAGVEKVFQRVRLFIEGAEAQ
ncbi:alpha/beta fold hydrolase [Desulfogranum marinum]|uniref:alpha/beta fold hydrolase n=1 Tax=Desulfogranum marinum TaxID=453220 RepID=UPI00196411B6|nr:alpha/beta fold hydrolase [Desulfogranum marinum]MBM9511799.1 alpha/beta fold hydrolase [Desulfogranum marinum]